MNQEDSNTTLDELYATIDSIYATHPEVVPVDKEQSSETVISTPQQAKTITTLNLTKSVQQHLADLRPTTALTEYTEVILSEDEIQYLKPVQERTIIELLSLTFGKGCSPVMLNGALLVYTADGKYLKLVPYMDKKGYSSYRFTAINYKVLNQLVDKYCELLQKTDAYENILGYRKDEGEIFFGIEPEYDYNADTEEDYDYADYDDEYNNNDHDACTLSALNAMLKARMQSSKIHLSLKSLSERIASQKRLYAEDKELLEYLQVVTNRVYRGLERRYHIPFTKYYDTFFISGHYLSAWIYFTEEYNTKINHPPIGADGKIIKYTVDHIRQGIEYRSDNSPENLRIVLKSYNSARTSRSIGVSYQGGDYISLSAYCNSTYAGNYDNLSKIISGLQPGETSEYKGRVYTLSIEVKQLTVIDCEAKAPIITFNGTLYPTLAAFARAVKLSPDTVRKAISRAKEAGKTEFVHKFKNKRYTFYLDNDGNIAITI